MKKVSAHELAGILNGKLDFVLALYVLTEDKLCVKPVYKFADAFVCDLNIDDPEFCLIYCEADDPEEIFISYNSRKFNKILCEYNIRNTIFYGESGEGEYRESYYYDGRQNTRRLQEEFPIPHWHSSLLKRGRMERIKPRPSFGKEGGSAEPGVFSDDDYFNILYHDFIKKKIYRDCGIIAAYDKHNNFAGYLAYYAIAENIRDVSYIYVGEKFRGLGYGKDLLNFFVNKNINENKISYYSYADGEISENLAKSCGFTPCAERYEKNK